MARPRQRHKTRNPGSKVTRKTTNNRLKRQPSFAGVNPLIKESWDRTKTLRQNYEAMGLLPTLNGVTGGAERVVIGQDPELCRELGLDESGEEVDMSFGGVVKWVSMEEYDAMMNKGTKGKKQDADGNEEDEEISEELFKEIEEPVRVDERALNIGNKVGLKKSHCIPLSSLNTTTNSESTSDKPRRTAQEFIRLLEQQASLEVKTERWQSEQELLWMRDCLNKYGLDNWNAIAKDRKLNVWQMTANQIRKKVEKFLERLEDFVDR